MKYAQRITQLQQTLTSGHVYLISDQYDIRYLSGFKTLTPDEREAFFLVSTDTADLFLSSFSLHEALGGVIQHTGNIHQTLITHLQHMIQQQKLITLYVDAQTLKLAEHSFLENQLQHLKIEAWDKNPVLQFRLVKDEVELALLQKANQITHAALSQTLETLRPGLSEKQLKAYFEDLCRQQGVEEFAFPTIVAFGEHSALPHHQPTERQLQPNEAVLIDCGAKWQGYCADVTRTVWFGEVIDPEFQKIEQTIKEAYAKALETCKEISSNSLTAAKVDLAARESITIAGYDKYFIHTTGHGVGLYIHEAPSVNWKNEATLHPGTVITIEPGIYLSEKIGYRFENSVAITKDSVFELL